MKTFYSKEKVTEIRQDIIQATEKLYKKNGYEYVNLLRVSKLTHLSRPSIYNYYHSKEEIFLDILLREYNNFGVQIQKQLCKKELDKPSIAETLATIILKNLYLLELISSYENAIEENSSIEHLKEYRDSWEDGFYKCFMNAFSFQFPKSSKDDRDQFLNLFTASLYGIYPIICPSEERVSALKERGRYKEIDRKEFVTKTMNLLLMNID